MKRTLCGTVPALALVLSLSCALPGHAQFTGTVTITGYSGPGGAVEIPSTMNGLIVTAIGEGAFRSNTTVTSVSIPSTVTIIGPSAFDNCYNLANISFAQGLVTIESFAFSNCGSLRSIALPDTVTTIGFYAFSGCTGLERFIVPRALSSILPSAFEDCASLTAFIVDPLNPLYNAIDGVLCNRSQTMLLRYPPGRASAAYQVPAGITNIMSGSFSTCANLTTVTIADSVTSIGSWAFRNCTGLTNITIGKGVSSIEQGAFENTRLLAFSVNRSNLTYCSVEGVLLNKSQTKLVQFPPEKAGTYIVPSTVVEIEPSAFANCTKLKKVGIANSRTIIGDRAFLKCTNLTSLVTPNGVASIGDWTFAYCTSLTNITVPSSLTRIGTGAFSGCSALATVKLPTTVGWIGPSAFNSCTSLTQFSVPARVTTIEEWVFASCHNLAKVTMPLTITGIGNNAFWLCSSLTNIVVPNGATSIGDGAFSFCGLSSITMPATLATIGNDAFAWSRKLTTVSIPNSVTNIGDGAFTGCISLLGISVPASNPHYSSSEGVLFDKNRTSLITYPAGKPETSYAVPSGVANICDRAFGSSRVGHIFIPGSVTNIGSQALTSCFNLTGIEVESLNPFYASFEGVLFDKSGTTLMVCPGNVRIRYEIPEGVTTIGDYAFYGSPWLQEILIPDSVVTIGNSAFAGCTSLITVTLPGSITTIGPLAFQGCSSLRTIVIPKSVTSLGEWPFVSCPLLAAVCFEGKPPSISPTRIYDNSGTTVYYLPGTPGWGTTFAEHPTAQWLLPYPVILSRSAFGSGTQGVGFTVSWATNAFFVVEVSTDLSNPVWSPLATNVPTSGCFQFKDPEYTHYPARFYRVREW